MTLEETPSWPDYEAAKTDYEDAVELHGAQSAEACDASAAYKRLEDQCYAEAGLIVGP